MGKKLGRPRKYDSIEQLREQWRRASTEYYKNNRDKILAKASEKWYAQKREREVKE